MKKYFLLSMMLFVAAAVLPQKAKAQWTNPYQTYKMNGLIINSPKKTAAKSSKSRRVVVKKKVIRRSSKKRRVASTEKMIFPKLYYIALPERNYTI